MFDDVFDGKNNFPWTQIDQPFDTFSTSAKIFCSFSLARKTFQHEFPSLF